jgi:hypothetical protein
MEIMIVIFVSGLWQLGAHYFPYRNIFGREPHRVIAYAIGVLGFMLPISTWMLIEGLVRPLTVVWSAVAASGSVVGLLYLIDDSARSRAEAEDTREREEVLMKRL